METLVILYINFIIYKVLFVQDKTVKIIFRDKTTLKSDLETGLEYNNTALNYKICMLFL